MPPSQLQIATSSLQRLVKEEASYHEEMKQQEARIARLEKVDAQGGDEGEESGNREFGLRQERKALEETKAVFPSLRERITNAKEKLEGILEAHDNPEDEEVKRAKALIGQADGIEGVGG